MSVVLESNQIVCLGEFHEFVTFSEDGLTSTSEVTLQFLFRILMLSVNRILTNMLHPANILA